MPVWIKVLLSWVTFGPMKTKAPLLNLYNPKTLKTYPARRQWLTPVILVTQEAEIRKVMVRNHAGQILCETLSRKHPSQKRAGGVAQGVGPEFKLQYCK
jgi:hypothetical protein